MQQLSAGQTALRRIRWRVGASMMTLGVCLGVLFLCMRQHIRTAYESHRGSPSLVEHLEKIVQVAAFTSRFAAFSLAPLADSVRFTRLVLLFDALIMLATDWQDICGDHTVPGPFGHLPTVAWIPVATRWQHVFRHVVFCILISRSVSSRDGFRMQADMWRAVATYMALGSVFFAAKASVLTYYSQQFSTHWWPASFDFLAALFVLSSWRQRVQGMLSHAAETNATQRAAAGIAGLLGDETTRNALARATARFRCIHLSDLSAADVATNSPSPVLFARTQSASLKHGCDAFISHSWSDDSAAKWTALQGWCADFEAQHGREPRLWFDKCCVDQTNIEDDLRCLPVFLSGCSTLLVLCGESYLTRLWCIMELFTFTHMHGEAGEIEFVPLIRPGQEQSDSKLINEQLANFDAATCRSSKPGEEDRFLGIICAAFGSLEEFNKVVRSIFQQRDMIPSQMCDNVVAIRSQKRDNVIVGIEDRKYGSNISSDAICEDHHTETGCGDADDANAKYTEEFV